MGNVAPFCPKRTLAQHCLMSPKLLSQCSHNICLLPEWQIIVIRSNFRFRKVNYSSRFKFSVKIS